MENNKQQTAVEWLVEQLKSQHNIDIERLAVTDKANGMHKEQIIDARHNGIISAMKGYAVSNEQYFNETYGTE